MTIKLYCCVTKFEFVMDDYYEDTHTYNNIKVRNKLFKKSRTLIFICVFKNVYLVTYDLLSVFLFGIYSSFMAFVVFVNCVLV